MKGGRTPESGIVWASPVFSPTGHASAARHCLRALAGDRAAAHLVATDESFAFTPSLEDLAWYQRMAAAAPDPNGVCILHASPRFEAKGFDDLKNLRAALPGMRGYAAYTSFDTDRIPQSWVQSLKNFDQVWVPTAFHAKTFANSGIEAARMRVIPQAVDLSLFDARAHRRQETNYKPGFHFLSLSSGDLRDGWDLLLQAFLEEFRSGESVSLTFQAAAPQDAQDASATAFQERIEAFVQDRYGKKMSELLPIRVHRATYSERDWIAYLLAHDAFVAPFRGVTWGHALLEAMALEIPVAATNWGPAPEILNRENAWPIETEDLEPVSWEKIAHSPDRAGHLWAKPSIRSLRTALREIKENAEARTARTAKARETIQFQFSLMALTKKIRDASQELAASSAPSNRQSWKPAPSARLPIPAQQEPVRLAIRSGSTTSMGHGRVDFELAQRLRDHGGVLLVKESENPQILVSHDDPPSLIPPPSGCRWIWFAPWPLTQLPWTWKKALARVDEIWVANERAAMAYRRAGVAEEKIFRFPAGANASVFRPGLEPLALPTKKSWKALFVGPISYRKGWDQALGAFQMSFRNSDDVCLVVKISPAATQDSRADFLADIKRAREHRSCPEILVLENELSDAEMARLYAACQVFVASNRAANHGTAALEAMACGLPVIATEDAGLDELIAEGRGFFVPSIDTVNHGVLSNTLGVPMWKEPHRESLARLLRFLWKHPAMTSAACERATEFARSERSWERVVAIALERFRVLRRQTAIQTWKSPVLLLARAGDAAIESRIPLHRRIVEQSPEGGGIFGGIQRALFAERPRYFAMSSGPFQAPWDGIERLHTLLAQSPECAGAAIQGKGGTIALFDAFQNFPNLEPFETFVGGEFLAELVRRAATTREIAFEKCEDLLFSSGSNENEAASIRRLGQAQAAFVLSRFEEGFAELGECLRKKPDYLGALEEGARRHIERGDGAEAQNWARRMIQVAPHWSRAYFQFGRAQQTLGEMPAARDFFALANAMDPGQPEYLFFLGQTLQALGENEKAQRLFENSWALGHYTEELACSYARSLCQAFRTYRAVEILELSQRILPGSFLVRETLEEIKRKSLEGKRLAVGLAKSLVVGDEGLEPPTPCV